MRKLFAGFLVIAAIVVFYFVAIKPIEDESQSQHQRLRQQHQSKQHKQALKPSPENLIVPFPHIQGQTVNLEAFWMAEKGKTPITEVIAWPKQDPFSSVFAPKVVRFETGPKGIRLNMDPEAEMLRSEIVYSNRDRSDLYEHVAPWNGNGDVAQTLAITVDGKPYTLELTEIVVLAHDSRYYSDDQTEMKAV